LVGVQPKGSSRGELAQLVFKASYVPVHLLEDKKIAEPIDKKITSQKNKNAIMKYDYDNI